MRKTWSDDEIALLRLNYPLLGYKVCELFPSRTKSSVIRKADWLDLRVNKKIRKAAKEDRVGYFDIEASQLNANFGWMYCWSIKVKDEKTIISACVNKKEIQDGTLDKRIVSELVEALKGFTAIYTYYGTGFDFPFARTRALSHGLEFIPYGELEHHDLYYLVKSKLRLHRNRLENACELVGIKGKTHLDPEKWVLANTGNEDAIKYIFNHNVADVVILEELHKKLAPFEARNRRSV